MFPKPYFKLAILSIMKAYRQFSFACLLSGLVFTAAAQVPRTPLLEHFTQASCGPCAAQNPALQTVLDANPGVVYLKYQTSWPGTDPMNAHNPGQINQRVNFYDVNSVPQSVFDGNVYQGSPSGITQTLINNRASVSSPFTLSVSARVNSAQDSIFITANLTKEADTSNTAVYTRIAVVEKLIHFNSPPGSNGETDFHHVMKRMLPNPVGTPVPSSMAVGETQTIELAWKLVNVYDINELMVVAFTQNQNNLNVYQAASSEAYFTGRADELDQNTFAVKLYPNPASDRVRLEFPSADNTVVQVFNSTGTEVYRSAADTMHAHDFSVQNLAPGMYICRVSSDQGVSAQRMLIQAQ